MKYPKALAAYRERMRAAGFKRLYCEIHPDLVAFLAANQRPNECQGRCLERLLLGEARPRPAFDRAEFGEVPPYDPAQAKARQEAWWAKQEEDARSRAAAKAKRREANRAQWSEVTARVKADFATKRGQP